MTAADALTARTVTYRVTPADGLGLEPFEITVNGELDDHAAAISDAVAVFHGATTSRFDFTEVTR